MSGYAVLFCRGLIGAVFLVAVLGKLGRGGGVSRLAGDLSGLGDRWSARTWYPIAVSLVVAESAVTLALAWPPVAPTGLAAAAILLAVLAAGVGVSIRGGRRVRCRCFGVAGGQLNVRHLVRNLVLAVVALAGAALTPFGHPPASLAGALLAAGTGLLVGLAVTRLDDLVFLFSGAPGSRLGPASEEGVHSG